MRQREYAGNVQLTILVAGLERGEGGGGGSKVWIHKSQYLHATYCYGKLPSSLGSLGGGGCGGATYNA